MKFAIFLLVGLLGLAVQAWAEERTGQISSGLQESGSCASYSRWYSICTPQLPAGFRISGEPKFVLRGDRGCGGYAECRKITAGSDKYCYEFRMQGHSEHCGIRLPGPHPETGQSEGVISYTIRND